MSCHSHFRLHPSSAINRTQRRKPNWWEGKKSLQRSREIQLVCDQKNKLFLPFKTYAHKLKSLRCEKWENGFLLVSVVVLYTFVSCWNVLSSLVGVVRIYRITIRSCDFNRFVDNLRDFPHFTFNQLVWKRFAKTRNSRLKWFFVSTLKVRLNEVTYLIWSHDDYGKNNINLKRLLMFYRRYSLPRIFGLMMLGSCYALRSFTRCFRTVWDFL